MPELKRSGLVFKIIEKKPIHARILKQHCQCGFDFVFSLIAGSACPFRRVLILSKSDFFFL